MWLLLFPLFLTGCIRQSPAPISLELQKEISYGRELISRTAYYLGPNGKVGNYTGTRMSCQNCHLDAGTKPYGISLAGTFAKYPEYRAREGHVITIQDRINHCFERPMNGKPLPHTSREMRAIVAYLKSLSIGRVVGQSQKGDSLNDLIGFPKRAASVEKGRVVYEGKCQSCHGMNGEGKLDARKGEFIYPPLWGTESFNAASNMHRVSKLALFIKANMPLGATYDKPQVTDEEAFDVSAFINDEKLHPRPKSKWNDYPNISEKPIDFPYGPYADTFSEAQHKFGPFLPMIESLKKENKIAYF